LVKATERLLGRRHAAAAIKAALTGGAGHLPTALAALDCLERWLHDA
jgi:hypothetical protein